MAKRLMLSPYHDLNPQPPVVLLTERTLGKRPTYWVQIALYSTNPTTIITQRVGSPEEALEVAKTHGIQPAVNGTPRIEDDGRRRR